jgi:hypothetical protein
MQVLIFAGSGLGRLVHVRRHGRVPSLEGVLHNEAGMGASEYCDWLFEAVRAHPWLLYRASLCDERRTLVQKLVSDASDHSTNVLRRVTEFASAAVSTDVDARAAVQLTGLAVRTGHLACYDQESPLSLAMRTNNESATQLLLNDYLHYLDAMFTELSRPAFVSEEEIVKLFRAFPTMAVDFVKRLKLQPRRHKLPASMRCDFDGLSQDSFLVRGAALATQAWQPTVDCIWAAAKRPFPRRAEDTAWGVALRRSLVPIRGVESKVIETESAPKPQSKEATQFVDEEVQCTLEPMQSEQSRAVERSDSQAAAAAAIAIEYQKLISADEMELVGATPDPTPATAQRQLPFTQMLEEAVKAGDKGDSDIFDSEILQSIVE